MSDDLFIGIDVGTSGVRAIAIDAAGHIVGAADERMAPPRRQGPAIDQDPEIWWQTTESVLDRLLATVTPARVRRIAVDGTSGTLLVTDGAGRPLTPGLMYNDTRAGTFAERIAAAAPPESGAHGASSALAKLLHLLERGVGPEARHVLHQADWIAGRLCGRFGFSDENNALKLGYDPMSRSWPGWFDPLGVARRLLPQVLIPGSLLGTIAPPLVERLGLAADTEVRAGTTDGVAAFMATQAAAAGDAVTSLGSTLVLKVLSDKPVFAPESGVYSHRLGERWLAGGASNSGGDALLAYFSREQIEALTPALEPDQPTGLSYYPLPSPGERFPIRDPQLKPVATPRPESDALFLQALLEGVANVEAMAYARLGELGAPLPKRVLTVGGGARNEAWTRIRARILGVPVAPAAQTESAFGTALLARRGGPDETGPGA